MAMLCIHSTELVNSYGNQQQHHHSRGSINVLTELFPAVNLNAIMNMIATKYGINFNSSFFSSEQWRANLPMVQE
jgi:hypothetical protein